MLTLHKSHKQGGMDAAFGRAREAFIEQLDMVSSRPSLMQLHH